MSQHENILILSVVLLIMFLLYIYFYDHKSTSDVWERHFQNAGLTPDDIGDINHDDSVWYYQRISTCVGYGDEEEGCSKTDHYCAGGTTFGSPQDQVRAVAEAVKKGGIHSECPHIYQGG